MPKQNVIRKYKDRFELVKNHTSVVKKVNKPIMLGNSFVILEEEVEMEIHNDKVENKEVHEIGVQGEEGEPPYLIG